MTTLPQGPLDALDAAVSYEGTAAFLPPERKRPAQVWWCRCGRTIIDPIVERVCAECEPCA